MKPFSIRIIFWLTEIIFWLANVASVLIAIGCIIIWLGYKPADFQLHVQTPFVVDFCNEGIYLAQQDDIKIRLVEMEGRIHFVDTPLFILKPFAVSVFIVLIVLVNMVWMFRNFIREVYKGNYFRKKNIRYLKYLSIWILALWFSIKIYISIFYHVIKSDIHFDNVEILGQVEGHNYLLIVALFIWVLSHIFYKGIALEETQKYTV